MIAFHYIYWFLVFFTGIFQLFDLPSSIYKLGIPVVVILLIIGIANQRKGDLQLPFIRWFLLFLAASVLSGVINNMDWFSIAYFLNYTIISYLYFLVIINEKRENRVRQIVRFVLICIFIQVPASLVKFYLIGQSEKGGIGTMEIGAGSLSTVFPALIIAFLISYYLFTKKRYFLVLIALFLLFGLIGAKRAIVFIVPIELFIGYLLFVRFTHAKLNFFRMFIGFPVLAIVIFYFAVRVSPTLNREQSNWGSFDVGFVMDYATTYNATSETNSKEISRQDGLVHFTGYILDSPFPQMMLGDGAGNLVESQYKKKGGTMLDIYGVRYGGRMGFIWILLQVGLTGTIAFFGLIYSLNKVIFRMRRKSGVHFTPLMLGFILATIFMFVDTIIYSNSFVRYEVIKGVYFLAGALIIRQYALRNAQKGNSVPEEQPQQPTTNQPWNH